MENQLTKALLVLTSGEDSRKQVTEGKYKVKIARDGKNFLCCFFVGGRSIGAWESKERAVLLCNKKFTSEIVGAITGAGYSLDYII